MSGGLVTSCSKQNWWRMNNSILCNSWSFRMQQSKNSRCCYERQCFKCVCLNFGNICSLIRKTTLQKIYFCLFVSSLLEIGFLEKHICTKTTVKKLQHIPSICLIIIKVFPFFFFRASLAISRNLTVFSDQSQIPFSFFSPVYKTLYISNYLVIQHLLTK